MSIQKPKLNLTKVVEPATTPAPNTEAEFNSPDQRKFKLDRNGNKIDVNDPKSNAYSGDRLSPIIGGSPLGGFVYDNTNKGYTIEDGNGLNSVKSLFKNTNIKPYKSITEGGFNSNIYKNGIINAYNDSTYDISTLDLIDWSKKSKNASIELDEMDFIFLKNLGVYTNNRLIIARRFPFGIYDDLTNSVSKNVKPISKLVSWVKDGENFIDIDFSEKWVESDASFIEILNGIGKDLTTNISKTDNPTDWGSAMAAGGGIVPLAGFTEVFQYNVLNKLAGTEQSTVDYTSLPQGNPNLIRQSKRRDVARDGKDNFNGVNGAFKVSMKVEYEQKYVYGIDPAFAYYSIIANALNFGTSVSSFNFTGNLGGKLKAFVDKISSGDGNKLLSAIKDFVLAIVDALKTMANQLISFVKKVVKGDINFTEIGNKILDTITKGISSIINKYKVKIIGVINSLTGTPSGPWHITIGNPKHPIFSSGDMIADKVKMTLGNVLSFNDLPSSITLEIDFTSARNLGGQEIFQKLNCGKERTYAIAPGYQNGIDFLTQNSDKIAKETKADADKIIDENKSTQKKLNAESNTNKEKIEPITNDIKAKVTGLGLKFTEGSITALDQATAVQEWLKNYKKDGKLDDKIKWIASGSNPAEEVKMSASTFFTVDSNSGKKNKK
jgi:hypothetical protein